LASIGIGTNGYTIKILEQSFVVVYQVDSSSVWEALGGHFLLFFFHYNDRITVSCKDLKLLINNKKLRKCVNL